MSAATVSPSTLFATVALLLVPVAVLSEHTMAQVWNNRLYLPPYQDEGNRHTPLVTEGTYLPPVISTDTTYTQADAPLLLTTTTHIPAGVTVTLGAGVTVKAHEFATLLVDGTLLATGTTAEPVTFTTNEAHADNQNWNGLIVNRNGHADLQQTVIKYASPGLTCMPASIVMADNLHTSAGLVGVHTESETCTVKNSRLQAIQYGVVARGVATHLPNTVISAGTQDILTSKF